MTSYYSTPPFPEEIITVVRVRLHGVDYHVHIGGEREILVVTYAGSGRSIEDEHPIENHQSSAARAIVSIALKRTVQ